MILYKIMSNDGWQSVQFSEKKRIQKDGNFYLLLRLDLIASFWNREDLLFDQVTDLLPDKDIKYLQLCISLTKWNRFIENVSKWEEKGELFFFEFFNEQGELFSIDLDASSQKLISSKEEPVLTINIEDSRSNFIFRMIIDRSSFVNEFIEN